MGMHKRDILADAASTVVQERYAVIYSPRRSRDRFPEECVTLYDTELEAVESEDPDNKRYAAKVAGPSRSSEGIRLYYLVHWL